MRDRHLKQLAIQLSGPEIQEALELWEPWSEIVILPDVALQQSWVIGQTVDDLRCGQTEALQLSAKIRVAGGFQFSVVTFFGHWQSPLIGTLRVLPSHEQNVR